MSTPKQLKATQTLAYSARFFCRILTPALVLAVLLVLAAYKAGMGLVSTSVLLLCVAALPGLITKRGKLVFQRRGWPDSLRPLLVVVLVLGAAVTCYWLRVPQPVPATVTAMFGGNVALAIGRSWLNVSAHVSVISFAVLWTAVMFGGYSSVLLVLSPLMLWARVFVREHKRLEALAGALLGLATYGCFAAAQTWS